MGIAADVTAADLVDSLLNSISSTSGSASASSDSSASGSESASSSSASSSEDNATTAPVVTTAAPVATTATPATTAPSASVTGVADEDDGGSGSAAGIGIGLAVAAVVMVACVFLYLRRRKRLTSAKTRRQQFGNVDELGPAEPSIELPHPSHPLYRKSQDPGVRGSSMYSTSSSARFGGDGGHSTVSVFNTVGGVSPTGRKYGASGYQFRTSSASSSSSSSSTRGSATIPTAAPTKLARVLSGHELPDEDSEYEQLNSTSAAAPRPLDGHHEPEQSSSVSTTSATIGSISSLHDSASSDVFRHGDGLGERLRAQSRSGQAAPAAVDTSAASPPPPLNEHEMEQAMDSSLINGRTKRTGSVYDTIPTLAGEKMPEAAQSPPPQPSSSRPAPIITAAAPTPTATASFIATPTNGKRAPPPPPPVGVAPFVPSHLPTTTPEVGSYVGDLPLSSFAGADDLEFEFTMDAEDATKRASTVSTTSSTGSASTRDGSLIAMVETTGDSDNTYEIQI